eukprot:11676382-Ditylum_brightwellii.AAC.1
MDEDGMVGRGIWVWLEHRACEARKYISPILIVRGQNDVTGFHCLSIEQLDCPWGGIPYVYLFGDCYQSPPVGMNSIHGSKPAAKVLSSDFVGVSTFNCFLNRHPSTGTKSLVVMIDEVVRQQDLAFLDVLDAMQNRTMKDVHVNFLLLHCLSNLSLGEKDKFKDAPHIMPTWKQTVPITVQYLKHLNVPIAK